MCIHFDSASLNEKAILLGLASLALHHQCLDDLHLAALGLVALDLRDQAELVQHVAGQEGLRLGRERKSFLVRSADQGHCSLKQTTKGKLC